MKDSALSAFSAVSFFSRLIKIIGLAGAIFLLYACTFLAAPFATPTARPSLGEATPPTATTAPQTLPAQPSPTPGAPTENVPTPAIHKSGLDCVGAAVNGGHPPAAAKDLFIQINLPNNSPAGTIAFFKEFARPCDGIGIQARFAPADWRASIGDLQNGLIFYSSPSLALAIQTADSWTTQADWFAYELVLRENTPASESSNPGESSRMAMEFAHSHNMAYMATPGRPVTARHAPEMAQYADAYGLQSYGEQRESPDTFIQLVSNTSQSIRAVKPDILFFVAFSTDQGDDDAQTTFALIQQLMGEIDGVFLRTDGSPESVEKLKALVGLLRGK